jgi:hypothetical protein
LKICDFGLSRAILESQKKSVELTDYVTTRWYRAPELLLSWPDYTTSGKTEFHILKIIKILNKKFFINIYLKKLMFGALVSFLRNF